MNDGKEGDSGFSSLGRPEHWQIIGLQVSQSRLLILNFHSQHSSAGHIYQGQPEWRKKPEAYPDGRKDESGRVLD